MKTLRISRETMLFFVSLALLIVGGTTWFSSAHSAARTLWICGDLIGLTVSVIWTVAAVRRRQLSVDIIAVLALLGALVVDEPFAGAMITVMLATGQLLSLARRREPAVS